MLSIPPQKQYSEEIRLGGLWFSLAKWALGSIQENRKFAMKHHMDLNIFPFHSNIAKVQREWIPGA